MTDIATKAISEASAFIETAIARGVLLGATTWIKLGGDVVEPDGDFSVTLVRAAYGDQLVTAPGDVRNWTRYDTASASADAIALARRILGKA